MRGAIARKIRQQADQARNQAIGVAGQMTQILNTNEETTRKRVEELEKRMSRAVIHRESLIGRLRWLFLGK